MHGQDLITFLAGSTVIGILGHAVNTFPTPANKYGQWLLGTVQYIVGQRIAASNTIKGNDTVAFSQPIDKRNG